MPDRSSLTAECGCGVTRTEASEIPWTSCAAPFEMVHRKPESRCSRIEPGRQHDKRCHTLEQVIRKLTEGDKLLNQSEDLDEVCRQLEIAESTWYRRNALNTAA